MTAQTATTGAVLPTALDGDARDPVIDRLRGLALFGVMAVNVVSFRHSGSVSVGLPPTGLSQFRTPPLHETTSGFDDVLLLLLRTLFEFKAVTVFTLLFGIGLAMQFERWADQPRRGRLLVRRLLILGLFGVVHAMLWSGDILTAYAFCGLLALPLLYLRPSLMLATGVVLLPIFVFAEFITDASVVLSETGELSLVFLVRTLMLICIGAAVWRFRSQLEHHSLRELVVTALATATAGGAMMVWREMQTLDVATDIALRRSGTLLLAGSYIVTIVAACRTARGLRGLAWAAPLGRMTLTNYLLQTLVFTLIFVWLNFRCSYAVALLIGTLTYALQVVLCRVWLAHFRHGPMEALLRRWTYRAQQRRLLYADARAAGH